MSSKEQRNLYTSQVLNIQFDFAIFSIIDDSWRTWKQNRREIEPKEILSCLICCLLVVFTQQLEILVTTPNKTYTCKLELLSHDWSVASFDMHKISPLKSMKNYFVIIPVPGYISRSVAGSYDNEGIAIFALQFTYFLWVGVDLNDLLLAQVLNSALASGFLRSCE